jgi:hypothetical protein
MLPVQCFAQDVTFWKITGRKISSFVHISVFLLKILMRNVVIWNKGGYLRQDDIVPPRSRYGPKLQHAVVNALQTGYNRHVRTDFSRMKELNFTMVFFLWQIPLYTSSLPSNYDHGSVGKLMPSHNMHGMTVYNYFQLFKTNLGIYIGFLLVLRMQLSRFITNTF